MCFVCFIAIDYKEMCEWIFCSFKFVMCEIVAGRLKPKNNQVTKRNCHYPGFVEQNPLNQREPSTN